jgi:hypothetical protein
VGLLERDGTERTLRDTGELEEVEKELENSEQVVSQGLKAMVEITNVGRAPAEFSLNLLPLEL